VANSGRFVGPRLVGLAQVEEAFGPSLAHALLCLNRHHTDDDGQPYWYEIELDELIPLVTPASPAAGGEVVL
jgi:hypothetical protein